MFDGELPAAECELLARRLVRDEALRAQWSRYALIGAALRAERGVKLHDRVARRVQSAIAQEASYGDSAAVDGGRRSGASRSGAGPRGFAAAIAGCVSRVRCSAPALPRASPRCPSCGCAPRRPGDPAGQRAGSETSHR